VTTLTFKEFLIEGLIEVPESLLKKLEREVISIIFSAVDAKLKQQGKSLKVSTEVAIDALSKIAKKYSVSISSAVNPYQKVVKRTVPNVTKADLPERYRDLLDKNIPPFLSADVNDDDKLTLQVHLFTGSKPKDWAASYSGTRNKLKINLSSLINAVEKIGKAIVDSAVVKRVIGEVERIIDSIRDILEHELTHYLQLRVFSRASPTYLNPTDFLHRHSSPEYYRSEIEFDPLIKTTIGNVTRGFKKLKTEWPEATIEPVLKYVVGEIQASVMIKQLKVTDDGVKADLLADYFFAKSEFFKHLRSEPGRWEKAVKLLSIGVKERLK